MLHLWWSWPFWNRPVCVMVEVQVVPIRVDASTSHPTQLQPEVMLYPTTTTLLTLTFLKFCKCYIHNDTYTQCLPPLLISHHPPHSRMAHMCIWAQWREEKATKGEEGHDSGCCVAVPTRGNIYLSSLALWWTADALQRCMMMTMTATVTMAWSHSSNHHIDHQFHMFEWLQGITSLSRVCHCLFFCISVHLDIPCHYCCHHFILFSAVSESRIDIWTVKRDHWKALQTWWTMMNIIQTRLQRNPMNYWAQRSR